MNPNMPEPQEAAAIIAVYRAIVDEARMFHTMKYTQDCGCATCAKNRASVTAKHEITQAVTIKALADLRTYIEENDIAIMMIKLISETKSMIKHGDFDTTTE
jgi:hypothetical protein